MPRNKKSGAGGALDTGRRWRSIREAFWVGRLGLPLHNGEPSPQWLELLHAALATRARRVCGLVEQADDLYGGNRLFAGWHGVWMYHAGLTADTATTGSPLSPEGWSALLMLSATRPHRIRGESPRAASVRQLSELGMGPEDRADRLDRLEQESAAWHHAFVRRTVAHKPAVVLVGPGRGPVVAKQTDWILRMETEDQRDVLYDWLGQRLDRWHDWGALAAGYGAAELTHRLLVVMAASLAKDPRRDPSDPGRLLLASI